MEHTVEMQWDEEAGVWYAICDSIPLALESNSFDSLVTRVKIAAPEILSMNGMQSDDVRLCFKTNHWENVA